MATYYRKSNAVINKEFSTKYGAKAVVIFKECAHYQGIKPKVTVTETAIEVMGTPYQIFNMKRSDHSDHWEHFYDVLGIQTTIEQEDSPCSPT